MSVFQICHILTHYLIFAFVLFIVQPVLLFLCKWLSLSCMSSLHLRYHFSPSWSAEALGHHPPAPANPCISFPIAIPAGLWHGGDERTFPLWLYIWFNGMIIGAISVCVCVDGEEDDAEWGQRPWPHPGDTDICALSLSLSTHTHRVCVDRYTRVCVPSPQNAACKSLCLHTHTQPSSSSSPEVRGCRWQTWRLVFS